MYDLMFLVPRQGTRRFPEDFHRRESTAFNHVVEVVATLMEKGVLKLGDSFELSLTLWAQIHGLVALYRCGRFGEDSARFRKTVRRCTNHVLEGLI